MGLPLWYPREKDGPATGTTDAGLGDAVATAETGTRNNSPALSEEDWDDAPPSLPYGGPGSLRIYTRPPRIVPINRGADAYVQSLDRGDIVNMVFLSFPSREWEDIHSGMTVYKQRLRTAFGDELEQWSAASYNETVLNVRNALLSARGTIFIMMVRVRGSS
ncbi:hypothetical protein QBC40DRAFT_258927 [Triangularia verruculosa]|uniref:Uncharacterized protein n=1 Tax=Triangularia verruculosa TaxID=2587418 RepID=A0AAN7AQE2_9PEZI|nr:hypothetical protein QBC40DRAFT_258927 [Triangularia verruculosa]